MREGRSRVGQPGGVGGNVLVVQMMQSSIVGELLFYYN